MLNNIAFRTGLFGTACLAGWTLTSGHGVWSLIGYAFGFSAWNILLDEYVEWRQENA